MRIIFNIAKNELKTLFFSPIAWLIFIIFSFQTGFEFSKLYDYYVQTKAIGDNLFSLTERMLRPMMFQVQGYLYLYIPLLTMGLMSREYSNQSIKLLYSSPIRNSQIIMGKYIAILIYALVLMLIVYAFIAFSTITVKELDVPYLLSGLLGLFLLACAYCSIGLFMSTLTSYQVVAAMATLATLTFLNFVNTLWQDIPLVSDITYWLSIKGRSSTMIAGLITSEDFLYFVIVSMLFVTLSIIYLQTKRRKISISRKLIKYCGAAAVAVAAGYVTTIPTLKLFCDSTATGQRTLMPQAQQILKQMDDKLTITAYVNLFDPYVEFGLPEARNKMERFFADYQRFKPRMKLRYVYYYMPTGNHAVIEAKYPDMTDAERAAEIAKVLEVNIKKFLTPDRIAAIRDFSAEDWSLLWEVGDSKGNRQILRTFLDNMKWPGNPEKTTAFNRLRGVVTNVGMLSGHGERSANGSGSRDYSGLMTERRSRNSLLNHGFDFAPLNIALLPNHTIPDSIDLLIIADPRQPLQDYEVASVASFIDRGGNMIVLGEPGRQDYVNPILKSIGMELSSGRLVQKTDDYDQTLIQGNPADGIVPWNEGRFRWMLRWQYKHVMPGACEVVQTADAGFDVTPIIRTDSTGCWNELETINLFEEQAVLNPAAGEREGVHFVAQALERSVSGRERNQRIVVFGDADWMSNNDFFMRRQGINIDNDIISTAVLRWLTYGDYPVLQETERPRTGDNDILHINPDRMPIINILLIGLIPAILTICFSIIRILRKNK